MLKSFYIPYYNDDRMLYVKEELINNNYRYENNESADFIVLPIKPKKEMINEFADKTIFYGYGNYKGYDYSKYDSFELLNAYITAEAAIALYNQNSKNALLNSNILICGYGKIAKALHKLLDAYGANITICSRSEMSKAEATRNNANHIFVNDLKNSNEYDVIFNTIPHLIFTSKELDNIKPNTLLIDLASFPGGVDTHYAKSKDINLIDGTMLPSRFYPKTAGYLIADAIDSIIKEERL